MIKKLIEDLIDIIQEKKQVLASIYKISKTQMKSIEDEDVENLNKALDEKDRLMKQVDKLDEKFLGIFANIKEYSGIEDIYELSTEDYPELRELGDRVREVSQELGKISILDDKNRENMKEKLEETKSELRRVKKGQKAYKGYNVPLVNNILIDEKK